MEIHDTSRLRRSTSISADTRETRAQSARSFAVPLPLRAGVWSKLVSSSGSNLFSGRDPRSSREAAAVRRCLAEPRDARLPGGATPRSVEKIHRDHSDVFSVLGRSVLVRDGRVDVPGGATAVELWELAVGASASMPDVFVDRLLAADTGELAALYDTVQHLDAPHQRFMLGLWIARRVPPPRALCHALPRGSRRRPACRDSTSAVRAYRTDLLAVVSQLRVLEDGRPAPPASPAFWRSVFTQLDRWPDTDWSPVPPEPSVDATWFVETVMLSARPIWEQVATVAFAQRMSPRRGVRSTYPDRRAGIYGGSAVPEISQRWHSGWSEPVSATSASTWRRSPEPVP